MTNLLFVCSANALRSPTAERVFGGLPGINAIGAGTNADAPTTVSGDLIDWADIVMAMERGHRDRIARKFQPLLRHKRLVVLAVPDRYEFMQPELITLLKRRVSRHLVLPSAWEEEE